MSTDANLVGKGDFTQNVNQTVANTEPTVNSVQSTAKSAVTSFYRPLQLELSLIPVDSSPSQAEALYLVLYDAGHAKIDELEATDQADESEEFSACVDQLHQIQDTQSDIVRMLFARFEELNKAHSNLMQSSASFNEVLAIKENAINQLEKDLDFVRKLALSQADALQQFSTKATQPADEEKGGQGNE